MCKLGKKKKEKENIINANNADINKYISTYLLIPSENIYLISTIVLDACKYKGK